MHKITGLHKCGHGTNAHLNYDPHFPIFISQVGNDQHSSECGTMCSHTDVLSHKAFLKEAQTHQTLKTTGLDLTLYLTAYL